jgi:hypothetical protein
LIFFFVCSLILVAASVLTPAQDFLRERFPPRAEVTSTKTVLKFFLASPIERCLAFGQAGRSGWQTAGFLLSRNRGVQ